MLSKIFLFMLTGFLVSCSAPSSKVTSSEPDLCRQLPIDLRFVHELMADSNSNYNGNAEQKIESDAAYSAIVAKSCSSNLDYVRAIKRYLASYHDPHVNSLWAKPDQIHETLIEISTGIKPPPIIFRLQWTATGVFLQRYTDRYFVKALDPNLLGITKTLQVGDELKSCDGENPEQILRDKIIPYVSVSAEEAARYRLAPYIFAGWDHDAGTTLKCDFERHGLIVEAEMTWQKVPEDYVPKTFQASPNIIYEIEKTNYGHWIKLKSLAGYDKATIAQLQRFTKDALSLRRDKTIVMDLRGNSGGTSSWGTDWIHNLFGYEVNWDDKVKESVYISKGNIEHYERFFQHMNKSGGIDSDYARALWKDQLDALKGPLGTFAQLSDPPSAKKPAGHAGFKGQVIVLTDYNVFSSGETFLEQLRMMPRVKQAGIATNASTFYSDIRFAITPGGLPFDFPTKKDSGDPLGRKSGQALTPNWPLRYDIDLELNGADSLRRALELRL